MNGTNLFKIALRALANNKLRAFLTMLGIIIGVASVITMLAIGQGSKKSIQTQIAEMGSNMIMIHPGGDMRGGVRRDPSEMQTLKLENYEKLRDETNFIAAISPNVSSSGQLINGSNNYPSTIYGVGLDYLEIRQLKIESGEMLPKPIFRVQRKFALSGRPLSITCSRMAVILWDMSSGSIKYLFRLWVYWNRKVTIPWVWTKTMSCWLLTLQ